MRTVRFAFLCVMSVALVSGNAGAQEMIINGRSIQAPNPLMGQRDVKTGTARIRGRIVAADTGAPVRRAQVRITGSELALKTSLTDGEGRYEFRDLPAGRFTLTAQKPGYMTVQYGQTRPFESGKAVELTDQQLLDKADIAMPRGSVIAGRIADEFGDPIADATVTAMRSAWTNGKRRLQPAGRPTQTNDLGQYRIFGLAPGDYYVSATFRGGEMAMLEMAAAVDAGGGAFGSTPSSGYAPTYFPGTTSGGDAQKITLNVGQEAQGNDFALSPVRLVKIAGTVISSDGKPAEGTMVNAVPRSSGDDVMIGGSTSGRTDKNGNFTLNNVPPGEYSLQTRGGTFMSTTSDGGRMMFTMTMTRSVGPDGPTGGEPEFGSVPINVAGEDLAGVVILTSKGTTASGHVTFDGGTKPPGAANLRVVATGAADDGPMPGGTGAVKPDDTFELKGLAGTRMFRLLGLPPGWVLTSVRVSGQDVTDTGVEFKGNDPVTGLELVVTNKLTEINGSVRDASGNSVKDYTIVVFSDDPQKWTIPQTRYVAGVRPSSEGRYQVKNLPPGSYYAIAVEYIPQGEWGDPELLDKLKARAAEITIGEGERKTLDLKIDK